MPSKDPESKVFHALAALAEQVWVLKDRQIVMETVLADKGVDLRDELERFQPDEALAKRMDAERQQFIATVMASFGTEHAGT